MFLICLIKQYFRESSLKVVRVPPVVLVPRFENQCSCSPTCVNCFAWLKDPFIKFSKHTEDRLFDVNSSSSYIVFRNTSLWADCRSSDCLNMWRSMWRFSLKSLFLFLCFMAPWIQPLQAVKWPKDITTRDSVPSPPVINSKSSVV